jgi:hypothetical protein
LIPAAFSLPSRVHQLALLLQIRNSNFQQIQDGNEIACGLSDTLLRRREPLLSSPQAMTSSPRLWAIVASLVM